MPLLTQDKAMVACKSLDAVRVRRTVAERGGGNALAGRERIGKRQPLNSRLSELESVPCISIFAKFSPCPDALLACMNEPYLLFNGIQIQQF